MQKTNRKSRMLSPLYKMAEVYAVYLSTMEEDGVQPAPLTLDD